MSRVYGYDEASSLSQPTAADFAQELSFARESLDGLCQQEVASGAFIYGSAVTDPTPRSDIDILISAPAVTPELAVGVRGMTQAMYRRSAIPVDVTCLPDNALVSGEHSYFHELVLHEHMLVLFQSLAQAHPENVIGQNPLDKIVPPSTDLMTAVDTKLSTYQHRFNTMFMRGTYPHPELTLEQILNVPKKAGRHALGALMLRGRIPTEVLPVLQSSSTTKAAVTILGRQHPDVLTAGQAIQAHAGQYDQLVIDTLQGNVSRHAYNEHVRDLIEEGLPHTLTFTAGVLQAYRSLAGLNNQAAH